METKEKLLASSLEQYIREKHTQEECIGFIDGFKAALQIDICQHEKFMLENADEMGNTHYCKKCGLWNY